MGESVIRDKSYLFALRVVRAYKFLCSEKKEFILSKQLLRSGTAIGALVSESKFAQSKADFINKMSIALKEANETHYWINILKDTEILEKMIAESLINDVDELISLLSSIVKSSKINS